MSKYYSLERVKKIDAQFKILLGGRNIGKSYATKHDVVKECYLHGKQFIYLRRWDEDIKTKNAINYFADLNVTGITDGAYTDVWIYQSKLYLVTYDDNGKIKDKLHIGFTHALNNAERYKSQIFPNVDYIIYEEFITDALYLNDECNKLQNYTSTIFRDRVGVVYMIGNTISKLCPYFNEWKLDKVVKMKVNEIALFENTTDVLTNDGVVNVTVKVAVEMCGAQTILSKMAFGDSANMIVKNTWQNKTMPTIDNELYESADLIYTVFVYCDNLVFRMELLQIENSVFWYITPQTKDIKHFDTSRIVTDKPDINPLHTFGFCALSEEERTAFNLIRQGKIFYCNNSCGSDFSQVLRKYHIATL